jgi:hypothetical protein
VADKTPSAPKGTGPGGRKLWNDLVGKYEFETHEMVLLQGAARTKDDLDALDAVVKKEGVTVGARVHPALVEARQLRIALARLVAALRIPADEDDQAALPRLPAMRGNDYGCRHMAPVLPCGQCLANTRSRRVRSTGESESEYRPGLHTTICGDTDSAMR